MSKKIEPTGQPGVQLKPRLLPSSWYRSVWKRAFDFVAAVLLLILLSVPMILVAVAVKLTSPGRVLYRQRRPGRGGCEFSIFKFRSMTDSRRHEGPVVTRAGDHRVTKVGGFLRKWKLDELPQLFNVLRGEMSFVGPRPQPTRLWQYPAIKGWAVLIFSVRPGITSQATVNFRNEEELLAPLSFEEVEEVYTRSIMPLKMEMELRYLVNATLTSDLRIIFKTVLRVLGRHEPMSDSRMSDSLPFPNGEALAAKSRPPNQEREYVAGGEGD